MRNNYYNFTKLNFLILMDDPYIKNIGEGRNYENSYSDDKFQNLQGKRFSNRKSLIKIICAICMVFLIYYFSQNI